MGSIEEIVCVCERERERRGVHAGIKRCPNILRRFLVWFHCGILRLTFIIEAVLYVV